MKSLTVTLLATLLAASAHAEDQVKPPAAPAVAVEAPMVIDGRPYPFAGRMPCTKSEIRETANISVNFNVSAASFDEARTKYEELMQRVEKIAKQQRVSKFELQSSNYSLRNERRYRPGADEQSASFVLSGNAVYEVDTAENAFKLGDAFIKEKIDASVNGRKNRTCNNSSSVIKE